MDMATRLNQAMEKAGFGDNQSALSRASGVPQPTINRILKGGGKRGPETETIKKLAAACNVSFQWLMEGVGPTPRAKSMKAEELQVPYDANVKTAILGVRPIPVISYIQAGALKEISDPYSPGDGLAVEYVEDDGLSPYAFALEIQGDSMLPEFRPGDRVIIDPDVTPGPGDFVVAKNGHEEATFKKYRPRRMDANGNMVFELVPLNDDYPTLSSEIEPLQIIGTMVEHRKRRRPEKHAQKEAREDAILRKHRIK
jgi:SOS-response transcriptional repressor LexA